MAIDDSAPYIDTSPDKLAQQPASLSEDDTAPGKNWEVIYPRVSKRLEALRTWRWSWWAAWASLASYLLPRRYHWLITANVFNKGVPLDQTIVDSTATLAMQTCSSGLWSGLTPPTRPWFKMGIGLPWVVLDDAGKEWLEDTEKRLYYVLGQSNFYSTLHQAFQDITVFGTAPVIAYEDSEAVLRCYLPCAGEYFLALGATLTNDTLYREFTYTVQQIVDMFTLDNCPNVIRMAWKEGRLDTEFVVAHCIEPNTAIEDPGHPGKQIRVVPGSFAWRELYWLRGQQTESELSRRGFNEKPFFVGRWSTVSNDPYGRSPGMDCLGDTKQLQQETRRKGEFIDKLVRPPMGGNPELKNEPSSIQPGNITYASTEGGKKGFWPLFEVSPAALPPMVEDLKEIQARIKQCYFVDLFMAITNMQGVQPRNELELTKRDLERLQALGPFINLFWSECGEPMLKRALAIMERRRLLLPMPPSLRGMPLHIESISMMTVAQAAAQNNAITSTIAVAANASGAAKASGAPDPLDVLDLDESVRQIAINSSYPAKGMRTEQQMAAIRAARAKAQQAMTMAQMAPAGVTAAKQLSETNPQAGALGALLGAPAQGNA